MNWVLNDIKESLVILGLLMVFRLCRSMFLQDRDAEELFRVKMLRCLEGAQFRGEKKT